MKKLHEKVQSVLDGDIKTLDIQKMTGVPVSTVSLLRNNKRKVSRMSLRNAELLGDLYDKAEKMKGR